MVLQTTLNNFRWSMEYVVVIVVIIIVVANCERNSHREKLGLPRQKLSKLHACNLFMRE